MLQVFSVLQKCGDSSSPGQVFLGQALLNPLHIVASGWSRLGQKLSKWEALQDAEWHVLKQSKRSYALIASLPAAAPKAPRAGHPPMFHRISYPQNYYQSNFAHECAKRDV
jgi:hypothetical protein